MLKQLLTTIAITGALMTTQPAWAASPPNMLVIGTNLTGIRTLDPAQNNARTVSELISNLYDNLVQLSPDDLKTLKPMLATAAVIKTGRKRVSDPSRIASSRERPCLRS